MKLWLIIAFLLATIGSSAYYYYQSTQHKIEQLVQNSAVLQENNNQLVSANEMNVNTIQQLQTSYQQVQKDFEEVNTEFQIIRSQNDELRQRLSEHEIDVLASEKPELVERAINNASEKALRCFELLSGAPLNEIEQSATNAREFNSECPWLYEGE